MLQNTGHSQDGFALAGALLLAAGLLILAVPLLAMMARHNASGLDARQHALLRAEAGEMLELGSYFARSEGGMPSYLLAGAGPVQTGQIEACQLRLDKAGGDLLPAGIRFLDNASFSGMASAPGRSGSWAMIWLPASHPWPHDRVWIASCYLANSPSRQLALSLLEAGYLAGNWRSFSITEF